jgi:hypothetical protein
MARRISSSEATTSERRSGIYGAPSPIDAVGVAAAVLRSATGSTGSSWTMRQLGQLYADVAREPVPRALSALLQSKT